MKTEYRTRCLHATDASVTDHTYPVTDAAGRAIGAKVSTWEATFGPSPPEDSSWWSLAPGHYFACRMQATRNGKPYGATQKAQYFTTPEARKAAIQKYLDAAAKRAQAR